MSNPAVPPYPHAQTMRDHWWWRPGMRQGRHIYVYFVTFHGTPGLYGLVDVYQQRLAHLPGLDFIPHEWLHMTVQGIGFTDEISDRQRDAIHRAVQAELATVEPATVTFQPVVIHPEAVVMPAQPAEQLVNARAAIRRGITTVLGPDQLDGPDHGYRPHVTLAYNTTDRPSSDVLDTIRDARPHPVTLTIHTIELLDMNRDHRMYQWDQKKPARLGIH